LRKRGFKKGHDAEHTCWRKDSRIPGEKFVREDIRKNQEAAATSGEKPVEPAEKSNKHR